MPTPQHVEALKKRLVRRIAGAALVIAGLIAGLAVLDRANAPPPLAHVSPGPAVADVAPAGMPTTKPDRAAEAAAAPERIPPPAQGDPAQAKPEDRSTATPVQDAGIPPPEAPGKASAGRFMLQVGVFANVANAEALRDKLNRGGVAAQIETRVQVGPFADRGEAEAARQRLVALGVEPGIVLHTRK